MRVEYHVMTYIYTGRVKSEPTISSIIVLTTRKRVAYIPVPEKLTLNRCNSDLGQMGRRQSYISVQ